MSSAPPPVRRRTRRPRRLIHLRRQASRELGAHEKLRDLRPEAFPIEPGGMVELALLELGARLVAVLPDSGQWPVVSGQ